MDPSPWPYLSSNYTDKQMGMKTENKAEASLTQDSHKSTLVTAIMSLAHSGRFYSTVYLCLQWEEPEPEQKFGALPKKLLNTKSQLN